MAANAIFGAHGRDITAAELAMSAPPPAAAPITFHDVLTALNPLQYLPVVGTIYRVATGDDGSPGLRTAASLIGGALMGGPVGVLTSIAGALVEHFFHLEHLARSLVAPSAAPAATPPATPAATPSPTPALSTAAAPQPPAPAAADPVVAAQAVAAYGRVGELPARVVWGGRER